MPASISKVSNKTHGPVNSVIISTIIAIILFAIINLPASATYAYLFGSVATWWDAIFPIFFVGLAATIVWKIKPHLVESSPIKTKGMISLGIVVMIVTALLVFLMLTNSVFGANTPIALILVTAMLITYIAIYFIARFRKGKDLSLAYAEIPPE